MKDIIPIQVCSYRRSGTHLLMKSLFDNFILPDVGKEIDTANAQMDWYGSEKDQIVFIPWIKLFYTHCYPRELLYNKDKDKIIYIFRNGLDVLLSYHRSFAIPIDFNEWISPVIIKGWYYHLLDWLTIGVYSVNFDNLVNNFNKTMIDIETRFNLKRKNNGFIKTDERVGWSPSSKSSTKSFWNEKSLKIYNDIVDWNLIIELSNGKYKIN